MDWYDKFKRFLGITPRQESPTFYEQDRPSPPFFSNRDDGFTPSTRSFSMFTDPLEMHKYFEQQMSEMLRNFGFQEFSFPQIDEFSGSFGSPQIEEVPNDGELRDQFLKPGYEKAEIGAPEEKRDSDMDGKLDIRDWGSIFRGENSVIPHQREERAKMQFFGQSVTSKTVRNPDGSIEKHHTVRDSQGNEETTITRKVGDKEYTITKRRDKEGREETVENLVNLDEKEVDNFFPQQQIPQQDNQQQWSFFERFFK